MNKIQYKNNIGTLQYKRDFCKQNGKLVNVDSNFVLDDVKSSTQNASNTANTSENIDFNAIESQMKELKFQTDESNKKLDYIIEKFENYESNAVNTTIEDSMVVYDAGVEPMQSGDTYWEEKKGLFGSKMVKKTIK